MAEPLVPGERPLEPPASQSLSRALNHLRPFNLGPAKPTSTPAQRGADKATMHTTHATDADPQNGSAHESAQNGTESTNIHTDEDIPPLPIVIERIHARRSTRTSLEVVASAVAQYKLSGLSLSYNGGKDCLVLLILFLAGLHPYASHADSISEDTNSSVNNPMIPAIYALPPDPFPEVEDFVVSSAQAYHLSITKYTTAPPHTTLRSSFEDYLALHPAVRAIFVGTRRTDPHGAKLSHFDRTDGGWPDFMRIHPVIDWHYAEIWAFIRHLGLEYCQLYDMGYTSLGGTSDTLPNPRLKVQDEKEGGEGGYLPAYKLAQDLEERLGRN
ncbi:FAD synthetase [Penicillium longicatenatum]|uniref:FAD synthetase n=1 Tax=Penicillium longicatenatum TaxID=1561947 RepID=UPI0025475466|nr:FAD synthetase [Penicillium longicatenatum]KAJ5643476.1 FAD synthetase [Penicillium longicatenatum]